MRMAARHPELWRRLERLRFRARFADGRLLLTGPAGALPPDLAAQIRACRDDLVQDVARREQLGAELETNIRQAVSWLDLETAIAIASEAYQGAVLSRWQVTRLTEMAIIVARQIPSTREH